MGIRFACHHCGKRLHIKAELASRRGVCPACRGRFRIPAADAPASTPVDASTPTPAPPTASSPASSMDVMDHDATAKWYVRPPAGGQYGPADRHLLSEWITQGRVAPDALVWRDGWPQWRTASECMPDEMAMVDSASTGERHGSGQIDSGANVGPDSPPPRTPPKIRPLQSTDPSSGGASNAVSDVGVPIGVIDASGPETAPRSRRSPKAMIAVLSLVTVALMGLLGWLIVR